MQRGYNCAPAGKTESDVAMLLKHLEGIDICWPGIEGGNAEMSRSPAIGAVASNAGWHQCNTLYCCTCSTLLFLD